MAQNTPNRVPKYRKQKRRGRDDLAFVEIDGHKHYLGAYGAEASRAEYKRLIAEWLGGQRQPEVATSGITVSEVAAAYWEHAQAYYVKKRCTCILVTSDRSH